MKFGVVPKVIWDDPNAETYGLQSEASTSYLRLSPDPTGFRWR